MRLNEKNVSSFAVCSSPVDKEGYLQKKGGDLNRDFQRRWFVLKGNLLFYFLKKQDREPQGLIILEACSVQVSIHGRYSFEISFDGVGTRVYVLGADNDEDMQSWMKAISHASYEYLKSIVDELQRRVNVLSSSSAPQQDAATMEVMKVGAVATTTKTKSFVAKDTSVTLQELGNPIAPQSRPTTRIKKGILVDISEDEAPPIPVKKKSMTLNAPGRVTTTKNSGKTYTEKLLANDATDAVEDDNQEEVEEPPSHRRLELAKSLPPRSTHATMPPHSSPLMPSAPIRDPINPYSPPSTLDRTPVLQPSPSHSSSATTTTSALTSNGSIVTQDTGSSRTGVLMSPTEPSSHPPSARKLAAPLDPNKSFIEMHEDFTQAMKALTAERTANNTHPTPQ